MSLPAIFVGLALFLLTVPFVLGPLRRWNRNEAFQDAHAAGADLGRYNRTLLALRDLDFDHQMGVVTEDDYVRLRAQLLAEAARTIELADHTPPDVAARIEAAVRAHRRHAAEVVCRQCDGALHPEDRYCPQCGAPVRRVCPHCSLPIVVGDRFCTGCGALVTSHARGAA